MPAVVPLVVAAGTYTGAAAAIGTAIAGSAIGATAATAIGAGVLGAGASLATGKSLQESLTTGVVSGLTAGIGSTIGSAMAGAGSAADAAFVAADAAQLAGQGLSEAAIAQNLVASGVNSAAAQTAAQMAIQGASESAISGSLGSGTLYEPSPAPISDATYGQNVPVEPGVTATVPEQTPSGAGTYESGQGIDVMSGGQGLLSGGSPTYTPLELAQSNIDPGLLEAMSREQVIAETAQTPYFQAAQSNIDPGLLESMTAEQVATSPVLTSDVILPSMASPAMSLQDAFRAARLANNLLKQPQQQQQQQLPQQPMTPPNVDYNELLGLLSQRPSGTGLLGTQFRPQPTNLTSLIG